MLLLLVWLWKYHRQFFTITDNSFLPLSAIKKGASKYNNNVLNAIISDNTVNIEYKDKRAVDDVSLALTSGIWGLLGANGAGKTTLIRMIAGILAPSAGQIRYDGVDIAHLGPARQGLVLSRRSGTKHYRNRERSTAKN